MSTPMIRFESNVGIIRVTLVQQKEKDESSAIIIMDGAQFSNVLYALKAIEKQLICDGQRYAANDVEPIDCVAEDRAKTSPENFNELFASIDGISHWSLQAVASNEEVLTDINSSDAIENMAVGGNEDEVNKGRVIFYQQKEDDDNMVDLSTDEIYDPVNYSISQYGNTKAVVCTTAETLDECLYQPSIIVKSEPCDIERSKEIAMDAPPPPPQPSIPITTTAIRAQLPLHYDSISTTPLNTLLPPFHYQHPPSTVDTTSLKKIEKRASVRNCFLTKYAKLLCKKFWNTFDQRCLDVKNNRSFIRLSSKEQIKSLFDELHASVTDKEFEEMVGCPMGKEIFVTCTKTRVKLINLVIKLVDN